jgi:hypothetical protein
LFQAELRQSPDLSIGFRAELATSLVASSLRHGGIAEVRQLFVDWAGRRVRLAIYRKLRQLPRRQPEKPPRHLPRPGRVASLGHACTAKCFDCHGSHGVLKGDNPDSTIHPDNQLETCQTCHTD